MSTFVVGDVQGCYDPLRRLLDQVRFDPSQDTLWAAGDLVNRGPESLEVLRFVRQLGSAFIGVLGNHDLHLLAVMYGTRPCRPKDTLQKVLDAPDALEIRNWLCQLPLAHFAQGHLMVHAGVVPNWTVRDTLGYAQEVESVLRSLAVAEFLSHMYGDTPERFTEELEGNARLRVITNVLTRLRFCDAEGRLDLVHKRGPNEGPEGMAPWYSHAHRKTRDVRLLFGHWAALTGSTGETNVFALDTGCVWGNRLRALRLDDHAVFECDCS